jgi:hypothetical protein
MSLFFLYVVAFNIANFSIASDGIDHISPQNSCEDSLSLSFQIDVEQLNNPQMIERLRPYINQPMSSWPTDIRFKLKKLHPLVQAALRVKAFILQNGKNPKQKASGQAERSIYTALSNALHRWKDDAPQVKSHISAFFAEQLNQKITEQLSNPQLLSSLRPYINSPMTEWPSDVIDAVKDMNPDVLIALKIQAFYSYNGRVPKYRSFHEVESVLYKEFYKLLHSSKDHALHIQKMISLFIAQNPNEKIIEEQLNDSAMIALLQTYIHTPISSWPSDLLHDLKRFHTAIQAALKLKAFFLQNGRMPNQRSLNEIERTLYRDTYNILYYWKDDDISPQIQKNIQEFIKDNSLPLKQQKASLPFNPEQLDDPELIALIRPYINIPKSSWPTHLLDLLKELSIPVRATIEMKAFFLEKGRMPSQNSPHKHERSLYHSWANAQGASSEIKITLKENMAAFLNENKNLKA